jgi:hypothetical protein
VPQAWELLADAVQAAKVKLLSTKRHQSGPLIIVVNGFLLLANTKFCS